MIHVFICEDNIEQLNQIQDCVEKYILINDLDMNIAVSTTNPQDVLTYLDKNPSVSALYFLDINLGKEQMNGIQLGAEIRKINSNGHIVFITTHGEMVYTTFLYSVEAMDYIIKDTGQDIKERVRHCIDIAMERHKQNQNEERNVYTIQLGDTIRVFDVKDIIFFESSTTTHKVILHHTKGEIEFYERIKNLEDVDDNLVRCHQSFVINRQHIKEIRKKERIVAMSDGSECFVSFRNLRKLQKKVEKS